MRIKLLVGLSVGLGGCLDLVPSFDPMVGQATAARCVSDDSNPELDVSFKDDIVPMFTPTPTSNGCSCHLPTHPDAIGIEQSGFDGSTYEKLRAGGNNTQSVIVIPGDPCNSLLWQKLSAGPPFGSRMPFDGPPFLSDEQLQMIADWITEGANDN